MSPIDLLLIAINTSKVVILIHSLDLLSIFLIAIKLDGNHNITWLSCIIPTIVTDIITIRLNIWKYIQCHYLLSLLPRIIDGIGILCTKILFIIILTLYSKTILILLIFPLAISLVISSCTRYAAVCNKSKYEIFNTIIIISFQVIYKVIQPMLIMLNIYGLTVYKWADVFIPIWLLTFSGVAVTIILTTCKPLLHTNRSIKVREQALKLLNATVIQISAMSSCTLIFLVWLSQKFDSSHNDMTYFQILSPIIILFTLLIALDPMVLSASSSYQIYLDATLHQDYQHALIAARCKEAYFETIPNMTFLVQVSYNTYSEIPYTLELESKILKRTKLPIVLYDVIDTIEMCVVSYAASRDNSTHMLFSESAASIARVLSERRSTNEPVGQTYGADQTLYIESLARSSSSDHSDHSDIEYSAVSVSEEQSSEDESNKNPIVNQIEIEVNDVYNECIICFQQAPDACILNCGHVIMCWNCAVKVVKAVPSSCPVCRRHIKKLVKITSLPIVLHDNRTVCISTEGYSVENKLALAYIRMEKETQRAGRMNAQREEGLTQ